MTPPAPSIANGKRPQPRPLARTTIVHIFSWGVKESDGERHLIIETPLGERIVLPFTPDVAQECGASLMAPSVVRA
jgi:hypothetical protein